MSSSFNLPETSRRGVLKGMLAGVVAGAPVAAGAEPQSDAQQLEVCLEQLQGLLFRMHSRVSSPPRFYLHSREDGSFRLTMQGDVEFEAFDGDGIYLVSADGYVGEYLVREEPIYTVSGKSLGYSHFYGRARADDGGWDDHERFLSPNVIRKLGPAL